MSIAENIVNMTKKKKLHFSLLDPDKQNPEIAGSIAKTAEEIGSIAIMVGGSTLASQRQVDETVKAIKDHSNLPVILFPSGAKFLSRYADAVFFMSLLNSRNLDYVIREHVKGAPFVKKTGIEPISMGYVIVEPGMTAGRVGEVDLVKKDDIDIAVGYALASQYLGMDFFYLEAGSGAHTPVPDKMISSVKKSIDIPLIVGGGIRDSNTAGKKAKAGADIVVTGTKLEEEKNLKQTLNDIIKSIEE
jgi:phosphoglycerol geranylgeranyltransferase